MSTNTPYNPGSPKSLGQHFLTDTTVLDEIIQAADLTLNDIVVEVGPGRGILTKRLVANAGQIFTIELDVKLANLIETQLDYPKNLTSIIGDARYTDINELIGPDSKFKMVSNLPYYGQNVFHSLRTLY